LQDLGYDIEGLELNRELVEEINTKFPNIRVFFGDIASIDKPDNYYSGIVSYGVVEHVVEGIDVPLKELVRVLKKDGVAIVTVPSFNHLRRIKYIFSLALGWTRFLNPRKNNLLRRLFNRNVIKRNSKGNGKFKFHVYPQFGKFFEYRLTKNEFELEAVKAGFRIINSLPISWMDGFYLEFGRDSFLCELRDWKFYPSKIGRWLEHLLRKIPWFHNNMHALVLTK
jgi:SAM-dependent methyltransferase